MVLGWLKSWVDNRYPEHPVKLELLDGTITTIPDIIAQKVPELNKGYSFVPLFPSGHFQTAYTAIHKMESVHQVHYGRRLLTVENKTYSLIDREAEGGPTTTQLPYDSWEGASTFTIDYVVPATADDDSTSGSESFKPASQIYDLPPRTKYLDPAKEKSLLDNDRPLVIALHGLSGGSYESYIRAFVDEVTSPEYNFDALVLNARGCANHTITSPQLFNGLWTNDLRYLINEHIKPTWPDKKIYLIGFSLGGAILANYLGQEGSDVYSNIKAAAVMGTPWDFIEGSRHLKSSIIGDKVYSPAMCQNVLKLLNIHSDTFSANPIVKAYKDSPQLFQLNRLRDFDEFFTSRLFGLNCADDYYRRASPIQRLWRVRVPTIVVLSLDDPITGGANALPLREVDLNPYINLVTTSIGGHLGWFTIQGHRWYPNPLAKLFAQIEKTTVVPPTEEELPLNIDRAWHFDRFVRL